MGRLGIVMRESSRQDSSESASGEERPSFRMSRVVAVEAAESCLVKIVGNHKANALRPNDGISAATSPFSLCIQPRCFRLVGEL